MVTADLDVPVCELLRGRGGRHRHRRLRGLGPKDDEYDDPCDRDQEPEQVAPAVTGIAQSPDGHAKVQQQDRDAQRPASSEPR